MTDGARELRALRSLAKAMGVHTRFTDGLGRKQSAAPETLLRVCAALGAQLERPGDAPAALRALGEERKRGLLPPVLVAWEGKLPPLRLPGELALAGGEVLPLEQNGDEFVLTRPLPPGYHRLTAASSGQPQPAL